MTRKLVYLNVFQSGIRKHLATFKKYPPKKVLGVSR